MELEYGPFNTVFERGELKVPGHLVLMNVTQPELTAIVVRRIEVALTMNGADESLRRLLADANWRPHLVAAVAVWMLEDPSPYLPLMWNAVTAGSWVSPQLLAVLAVRDPDFDRMAQQRLLERCVVGLPEGLAPAERHSATGPSSSRGRSAKEASALLELAAGRPWVQAVASAPELQEMVTRDVDNGGKITAFWGSRVRGILDELGLRK